MIDGIDTGYEGKFDFPGRGTPPAITYMLATVPRSGSSYLSHLLWRTGCLGAPIEYLNHDPAGPYGFAVPDAGADGLFVGETTQPFVAYLNHVFSRGGFADPERAGGWTVSQELAEGMLPL